MTIKYLQEKFKDSIDIDTDAKCPPWTSKRNSSIDAWRYVEAKKKEKFLFLKTHFKASDYLVQKNYQIKASEVAKALGMNRSTLMHSSSYSRDFAEYLDGVNCELELLKNQKIAQRSRESQRGSIASRKDELVLINEKLKRRITELENLKIEELVSHSLDRMPLSIKRKLGVC